MWRISSIFDKATQKLPLNTIRGHFWQFLDLRQIVDSSVKKRSIFGGLSSAFDIYHTTDFNPNTRELVLFEKGINKAHVPELLQRLTKRFYAQNAKSEVSIIKQKEIKVSDLQPIKIHQCKTCFTIYDERFGDSVNGIPVGVKFTDLPSTYCCSVCEEAKSEFVEVSVEEGVLLG